MSIPRYYRTKLELQPDIERAIEHELEVKTFWRNKLDDIRYIRRLDDVGVTEDWIIGMAIKRARSQSERNALHQARNRKRKDV